MKLATSDLASALLKSLQEIYTSNPELFYQYYNQIWNIFEEFGKFISTDFFINQLCSMSSGSRMIYHVIEILKEIFVKNQTLYNVFAEAKSLERLLAFLVMLLKSARSVEGISNTNPQKHLMDEKAVFDFLELLNTQVKSQQACNTYHNNLLQFVKYDLSDLHSEAHCRRVLEILEVFYNNKSKDKDISLKELVIYLIKETSYLCCLRNKNEYVTVLMKNNKLPMQLWHFTVYQLVKILKVVLCNNAELDGSDKSINVLNDKEENKTPMVSGSSNEIWEAAINCFEILFKQSEGGYKNITRSLIEDLLKSCQEMEVLVINFIVNHLLPHSLKIPKEKQIKLLNLLDLGCNFDYNSSSISGSVSSGSISKVCISNLFDLCSFKNEELMRKEVKENADDYVKIKIKIAKMSTPILLRRCKEILKSYFDDELNYGSMPLQKSRIEDVKYVLENLKNLEVYPNYHIVEEEDPKNKKLNEEPEMYDVIMKNRKSPLFTLLPFFSEFITTKNEEIKLIIKDIFKIVSYHTQPSKLVTK